MSSVATVAASAELAEDRIEMIVDEIRCVMPFVGVCITSKPDLMGKTKVVFSWGYPDNMIRHLTSKAFLDEWRGLEPLPRGTRLKETWNLDPLPGTVQDYVLPAGFGGGVSIPLQSGTEAFGGMHFSTESAQDISNLTHQGLCLIAPAINNLADAVPLRDTSGLLSSREREVLELVARGRSNAQIAAELFISTSTTATHIEHILSKLGVANRAHAAVLGMRLRLIPAHC